MPQTKWFKMTETYHLTVLGARSPKWRGLRARVPSESFLPLSSSRWFAGNLLLLGQQLRLTTALSLTWCSPFVSFSSHGHLPCKDASSYIGLRVHPTWVRPLFNKLYLQIRSHSDGLEIRTSTQPFWAAGKEGGTTIRPTTVTSLVSGIFFLYPLFFFKQRKSLHIYFSYIPAFLHLG